MVRIEKLKGTNLFHASIIVKNGRQVPFNTPNSKIKSIIGISRQDVKNQIKKFNRNSKKNIPVNSHKRNDGRVSSHRRSKPRRK